MSQSGYSSSQGGSQDSNEEENYFKVFQQDYYLSASLHRIQQWKDHINLSFKDIYSQPNSLLKINNIKQIDPLKYIQSQKCIFDKQQNYLLAAYHIRYYAFAFYIQKSLRFLQEEYKGAYRKQKFDLESVQKLDEQIIKLTQYLQKIQITRVSSYITQIDQQILNQIYRILRLIFPMMISPYCIWRVLTLLQTIAYEQYTAYEFNIPLSMPLQYYLKTFKTLKFRNELLTSISLSINPKLQQKMYLEAYSQALRQLCIEQAKNVQNKEQQKNVHQQLKCQFLCCLKYMHFTTVQDFKSQNDIYMEYLWATLKLPYHRKNENIPTQYYEKLYLKVLGQFRKDSRLIDLGLYMDPNKIGDRSKSNFGKIEEIVLKYCYQLCQAQQNFLNHKTNPQQQYIQKLLKPQQFTLLIYLLETIMQFNKSSFLKADNQIYEVFLQMAQFLKSAFLSFGKDVWLFPQTIFTPLTLSFFKQISQDINDDLKNILYEMVQKLNHNKLPKKLVFQNNQFNLVQVTKLQYLCAIMSYIDDCSRQQQYLNLPQLAPTDFQNSLLLIKSLHVKLKHHEPNPAQMPLFTEYLKQCQKYKLKIDFTWYKQESFLTKSFQRQTQFQIQSGLPCKQIKQIFRKTLNYRDREYARKLIEQTYNKDHLLNPVELASMLKYNHGIQNLPQIVGLRQTQIFLLLQQINTMLAIIPDSPFDLPLQQQINVSYLHLLLTFYCTQIKQAQGSDVYIVILQKILLNYLKCPLNKSKKFRQKYPKFFQKFIYQFHQIQICATLNQLLMQFQDKYLPFKKDEKQWSWQQKIAVSDLRQKIQIVRDQFLDKLQGSQQQIGMFMVTFTSLIGYSLPFAIFLQCVRLFVKLIIRKPSLAQIASLNIFLSQQTYKQPHFFNNMLLYLQNFITQDDEQKKNVKIKILDHLLKSQQVLDYISFKELIQLLYQAHKILSQGQNDDKLSQLYHTMNKIVNQKQQKIKQSWILPYILLFYIHQIQRIDFDIFQQDPQAKNKLKQQKIINLMNRLKQFDDNKQFWSDLRQNLKDFKIKKYYFLFNFQDTLKQQIREKPSGFTFKDVWLHFLRKLSDPSWTFYFMVKLQQPSLINMHQNRDQVLINLIKKQKLTKESYPIFKNMISQTKNMPFILQKILYNYEKEQNYIENYQFHNKLILINQRFPDHKVQQCILKWIQIGQNKLPLKIPQHYYINFIKKYLKKFSDNIGYQSIFQLHKQPNQLKRLNKQIQNIFQVLLYFPIKKFQHINLSTITQQKSRKKSEQKNLEEQQVEQEDEGQWEQEDDETEQVDSKKKKKKNNHKQQNEKEELQVQNDHQEQNIDSQNEDQQDNNNYYDSQRPQILQIFYEQENANDLKTYKDFCILRQQIDVYLKSDYQKLNMSPIQDNEYLHKKLLEMVKQLKFLKPQSRKTIITYCPLPLYVCLQKLGIQDHRDDVKISQLRKPKTRLFKIRQQFFSDRAQSDGSQSNEDSDVYSSDDGGDDYDSNDEDIDLYQNEDEVQQEEQSCLKKNKKKSKKNIERQQEQIDQLPQLTTQFSKIQSQIKGSQLDKRQITKILEIFLVQMFKLTPINFKKKEIVHSYLQIMESQFSQVFFESVLTVLRVDQNHKQNRKTMVQQARNKLSQLKNVHPMQQILGLVQFSKYNGLVNFTYLLKTMKQNDKYPHDKTNPFHKQSGSILPVAQRCILQFDLPLQKNLFSLVLIYIQSKKKVRDLIEQISVTFEQQGQQLSKKQIKRICQTFIRYKTHTSVWQYIEGNIGYKVSDIDQLIISLDSYSQQVFKSLTSSAVRVKQTIQSNNKLYSGKINQQSSLKSNNITHLKHYQRMYYITSNLLSSCSQQIKQFYYMNKHICRYLWQDDDENDDTFNFNKVPKKLLKSKKDIFTNRSFLLLLQLAIRIIHFVKKQLYGKISSKKFNRLIHYPKLIVQTATLYMHLSSEKGTKDIWKFQPKQTVQKFLQKYQMGQYQFKSLIQVYNLILSFLQIQSFCSGKFKQLLLPYFIKNKYIGIQAPLMFKIPEIDQDVNGQNIYVTRECSFDMAFYQVNGEGLFVQFHGQQGSDHGGMIRELLMGWKGVGIGQEAFFIGKIIGISFKQSVPYGGHVDLQMCIKITKTKVTMQNIEQIDKQIYKSLSFVRDNDPKGLDLTFSVMKKNPQSFQIEQFDLVPNGRQVDVTEENKNEYIKVYLQKYYELGRQKQLQQIATGFYTVVFHQYAAIFKPHELMQHVKGQQVCDVNLLKAHVKYTEGYTQTSVIVKWLWQILQNFNQQQLNKFIQFLTGSPKLPIFNPNFQIIVQRVFEVKNLPVAHTCFNTLDLPQYPSKDILEKKLMTAIFQGNDSFGIM